jgi:pantoate--beta-alanine ligase
VREPDGLAMSSRNTYLSADERKRALSLSRGLREAQRLARDGVLDARTLVMAVRRELQQANVREDYVELVDARTLTSLSELKSGQPARLLVAGFLGATRLIDNAALSSPNGG